MNATLALSVRPSQKTKDDYQRLSDLWNACEPDYPTTLEETRFEIETIATSRDTTIYAAEQGGTVVGQVSHGNKGVATALNVKDILWAKEISRQVC